MPFVNFNSKWFQSYCRAVLENDPSIAHVYVKDALSVINEQLRKPGVENDERDAMYIARRYLNSIENNNNNNEMSKAS